MIGGTPKRSYNIIGVAGNRIIFLDPHAKVQQQFCDSRTLGFHHETAEGIQHTDWKRVDPSLLIGFYLQHTADFNSLVEELLSMTREPATETGFLHVEATRGRTLVCSPSRYRSGSPSVFGGGSTGAASHYHRSEHTSPHETMQERTSPGTSSAPSLKGPLESEIEDGFDVIDDFE